MGLNGKEAVMSDTVQVRHDALLKVVFRSGDRVLDESVVKAYLLSAHITSMSYIFNAAIDGGVAWRDPVTGAAIKKPTYTYELVDPDAAILKDGELCTCERCLKGET